MANKNRKNFTTQTLNKLQNKHILTVFLESLLSLKHQYESYCMKKQSFKSNIEITIFLNLT